MAAQHQICFYQGSGAARVARRLGRRYRLRAVPGPNAPTGRPADPRTKKELGKIAGAHTVWLADMDNDDFQALHRLVRNCPALRVIGIANQGSLEARRRVNGRAGFPLFASLHRQAPRVLIEQIVAAAFKNIEFAARERSVEEELIRTEQEMEELNRIGVALSATRDVNALLDLILEKSRAITAADAGSLYLIEEDSHGERLLRFKLTQNDSRQFPFSEFTMPITEQSMAGYVALHGEVIRLADAHRIPAGRPFHFNPKYDEESGYRTRSLLTLPMKNAQGEILGVLQLINSKRNIHARLTDRKAVDANVQPFSDRAVRLALSLASQAAVAYENSRLYQDIENLFEGFVHAAVTAIEQRDPSTSGHSQRVSTMTVALATAVDRTPRGPYGGVRLSAEQMKEIRYASLLHDFGKVGVREEVLVKAKKLYPSQLVIVQSRFDYIRKALEAQVERKKRDLLLELDRTQARGEIARLDAEFKMQLAEVDDAFQFILQVNEPTVLPAGRFERLTRLAQQTYVNPRGAVENWLTPQEVRFLSIPRGSLDPTEREEIESHVVQSFNFLMQIPWTKQICGIPVIARAHHEKLNGTGYPDRLSSESIPLPAKMMTICDIFDALSASDRPYKKAVSLERALDILRTSVQDNELDPDLFELFVGAKIYELTLKTP